MIDMSQPPTLTDLVVIVTGAGTVLGVGWRVLQLVDARIEKTRAAQAAALAAALQRVDAVERALTEFRLQVATDYVSRDSLRELEERLVAAIERLGDRLDRVLDRAAKTPGPAR